MLMAIVALQVTKNLSEIWPAKMEFSDVILAMQMFEISFLSFHRC